LATSAAQWAAVINTALSPRYLAIVVILVAVYALFRKTSLRIASYVPAAFVLAQATTTVLKHTINRERPPVAAQLVETHDPSFPSGHSSAAFAIAAALVILLWTKQWQPRHPGMVGVGVVVVASISAALRLYLKVHWLSDVLAGSAIGIAAAIIVWMVYRARPRVR